MMTHSTQVAHTLRIGTLLIASALLGIGQAVTALAASGELTLATQKAVVFKDGYALLIKQAKGVADEAGRVFTLDVPDAAVLGSFWAMSPDREIVAMRAEYIDDWKRVAAPLAEASNTLGNLLNQVADKHVEVVTASGERVSGTLVGRTTIDKKPAVLIQPPSDDGKPRTVTVSQADIVALHSPALGPGEQADPQFTRAKRLSFDLGGRAAGKSIDLTLMYFTPGLRWIPTYRVSGALKETATMALQGEILNQCEDLRDVALDLVVGVPHFRFRDVISPLTLETNLRNALAQAAPQLMGQMSNAMFTQRAGEWRHEPAATPAPADVALPRELQSTGEDDLFVYNVPNFSLKVGGRATLPLWQADAPLRHLYTLDLKVARDTRHGSMARRGDSDDGPAGSPLHLLKTQVWHQLELVNRSTVPWTTGAAMILRDQVPQGQDLLTYTPPEGSTLLPMTVAVDLRAKLVEEEVERQPNALQWSNHSYSLIRKKGTITLTSFRKAKSATLVTVSLAGKASNASDDGKIAIDDYHSADWSDNNGCWQNNHSDVTWELDLPAGETVRLTYDVAFYVP